MIDIMANHNGNAKITVIGVGGGGCNAVDRMIEDNVEFIEFVAVNTDKQVLDASRAARRITIGEKLTKGLGAGGDPSVGMKAAEESEDELSNIIKDCDMVFVTAGMGGGTGTGAAPVVARIAKMQNVLTVGVVTKPFNFEGKKRMKNAESGIDELRKYVDTLIVIPNQKLLNIVEKDTSLKDSFKKADEILRQGVEGIASVILKPGLINLDFADVKTTMLNKGVAHMGVGRASGKNKAAEAAIAAINSPLLETTMRGARNLLISIAGDEGLTLLEIDEAADIISADTHDEVETIVGTTINEDLNDEVIITVIATGLESDLQESEGSSPIPDFVGHGHPPMNVNVRPTTGGGSISSIDRDRERPAMTSSASSHIAPEEVIETIKPIKSSPSEMRPVRDLNSDARFVIPDFLTKKKK